MTVNRGLYRPDIDGLRGISVLAVLLFHGKLGAPGGFVGVDVFFVISGFLITTLLLQDLTGGWRSLVHFWERRIRRIFPAALFMNIVVLLIASLCLLPGDLEQLAKSSIAHSLFLSNVYFLRNVGYFDTAADLQPLLHTWSLAIEEQFYLVFPVVLFAFGSGRRPVIGIGLSILAVCSFLLNVFAIQSYPAATFYLLPTRSFELLTGALLAYFWPQMNLGRRWNGVMGFFGLFLIVAACLMFHRDIPFPGIAAIVPCLGAASVILSSCHSPSLAARFLSYRPLVFVGLISYSLYLWHWPVLALTRYIFGLDIDVITRILALVASFVIAVASWKFVEQPFRDRQRIKSRALVFRGAAGSILVVIAVGVGFWKSEGLKGFHSAQYDALLEDVIATGEEYDWENRTPHPFRWPGIGLRGTDSKESFLIWGDSHAMAVCGCIDTMAEKRKLAGFAAIRSGTGPFPGAWIPNQPMDAALEFNESVLDIVRSKGLTHVLIVARWSVYVEGSTAVDILEDSRRENMKYLRDELSGELGTRLDACRVFRESLSRAVKELKASGVKSVWLMKQVPEQLETDQARRWLQSKSIPWLVAFPLSRATRLTHYDRQRAVNEILDSFASADPIVHILDPTTFCFDENGKAIVIRDGRSCYRDDDHISRSGARLLLVPMFQAFFDFVDGIEPN